MSDKTANPALVELWRREQSGVARQFIHDVHVYGGADAAFAATEDALRSGVHPDDVYAALRELGINVERRP